MQLICVILAQVSLFCFKVIDGVADIFFFTRQLDQFQPHMSYPSKMTNSLLNDEFLVVAFEFSGGRGSRC